MQHTRVALLGCRWEQTITAVRANHMPRGGQMAAHNQLRVGPSSSLFSQALAGCGTAQVSLFTASTTASVVMPNCLYSTGPGAEAPKVSTPIEMPLLPTYFSQPKVEPA